MPEPIHLPPNLAAWATSVLDLARQSGIPTDKHSCKVALSAVQRRTILGLEIGPELRELLSNQPTGTRTFNFTAEELVEICHAIASPLAAAEGKYRNQLLKAAEKIAQGLNDGLMPRPKPPRTPSRKTAYQLKVTLAGVKPLVWRQFQVLDCNVIELHSVIEVVMGWQNCHLHCFTIGGQIYSDPSCCKDLECADGARVKLGDLIKEGYRHVEYVYDLGDFWQHTVEIESGFQPEESVVFPVCLEGSGSCPPEDVGGAVGYAKFLAAINDPDHQRHRELLDWCGGWFDPEAFDLEMVNRRLARRTKG